MQHPFGHNSRPEEWKVVTLPWNRFQVSEFERVIAHALNIVTRSRYWTFGCSNQDYQLSILSMWSVVQRGAKFWINVFFRIYLRRLCKLNIFRVRFLWYFLRILQVSGLNILSLIPLNFWNVRFIWSRTKNNLSKNFKKSFMRLGFLSGKGSLIRTRTRPKGKYFSS